MLSWVWWPTIAPYWSTWQYCSVSYSILTTDNYAGTPVWTRIANYAGTSSSSLKLAVIIEWSNCRPCVSILYVFILNSPTNFIHLSYSHNWTYVRIISLSSNWWTSETTSFQLTLATDGFTTWTLFQYAYPSSINENAYYPQQVGYFSGNDRAIVYSKNWWSPYYYSYTSYSYTPTYNPATAVGNSMLNLVLHLY